MALTSILKPDGFRPIGGSSDLIYTFTEASIVAKPNYRVEIEFNGLTLPVFTFYPDADLNISCNIASALRSVLAMNPDPSLRLGTTYVKYQAVWDTGSDAQVPLSSNIIYFYVGDNNLLNKRTQFEITNSGGSFLIRDNILHGWATRTAYIEFLNGMTNGWALTIGSTHYFGDGTKQLVSIPIVPAADVTATLKTFAWTNATESSSHTWSGIAYSSTLGLYVAVAPGTVVMTSPNGITWTNRTAAANKNWVGVTFGAGLFVAVASNDAVMTSPDGITWTSRTTAAANNWAAVTFGGTKFVAVSQTGTGNRVMTSPDGITWTSRTSAADNVWTSVVYGNGLYVAVSTDGGTTRAMTSPDGITWTIRTTTAQGWKSVTYGNGTYVAVASARVMTSTDGITWADAALPTGQWIAVVYGGGLFMAVPRLGDGAIALESEDGITWQQISSSSDEDWLAIAYGTTFVAVGLNSTTVGVMYVALGATVTSLTIILENECLNPLYLKWINDYGGLATWLFDYNQIYNNIPNEAAGRYKKMIVFLQSATMATWQAIQELNRTGAEYGDNKKLGAYVVDFTDEDDPINIFVEGQPASTLTKARGNNAQIVLRYPLIPNSDIS